MSDTPDPTKSQKKSLGWATAITNLELVLSLVQIVAVLTQTIFAFADNGSPAWFRATGLTMNASFAMTIISVYLDQDIFDFGTAFFYGIATVLIDAIFGYKEVVRWFALSMGSISQTNLENDIKNNHGGTAWITPLLYVVCFGSTVIQMVLLISWFFNRAAGVNGNTEAEKARQKAEKATAKAGARWTRIGNMILAILEGAALLLIVIVAVANFEAASFYRGAFFIAAGLQVGAQIALFAHTARWFNWLLIGLSAFASGSALYGLIVEWQRVQRCDNGAAVGVVENQICTDEQSTNRWVPIMLTIVCGLAFISLIFSLIELFTPKSKKSSND